MTSISARIAFCSSLALLAGGCATSYTPSEKYVFFRGHVLSTGPMLEPVVGPAPPGMEVISLDVVQKTTFRVDEAFAGRVGRRLSVCLTSHQGFDPDMLGPDSPRLHQFIFAHRTKDGSYWGWHGDAVHGLCSVPSDVDEIGLHEAVEVARQRHPCLDPER